MSKHSHVAFHSRCVWAWYGTRLSQWWTSLSCLSVDTALNEKNKLDTKQLEISSKSRPRGDALLVAKHTWFDNTNELFSQATTARLRGCRRDKCGKGKGKKIQNQKMRTEEKEIKAGGKKEQQESGRLVTAYSAGFEELSSEVRDRSGCPALLDSHSHTHSLCHPVSCLLFPSANKQISLLLGQLEEIYSCIKIAFSAQQWRGQSWTTSSIKT